MADSIFIVDEIESADFYAENGNERNLDLVMNVKIVINRNN